MSSQDREYLFRLLEAKLAKDAKTDFVSFCKYMMEDPQVGPAEFDTNGEFPSAYHDCAPSRVISDRILDSIEGRHRFMLLSVPPQHGKTQHVSLAIAWVIGRFPSDNNAFITYSQERANDVSLPVRAVLGSERFKKVFPDVQMRRDKNEQIVTTKGGETYFVGIGGAITGRTIKRMFVDDPYKSMESLTQANLNQVYDWFFGVLNTRLSKHSSVFIVHTRWHEDDIIGRLGDPDHPERHKRYAFANEEWVYFNYPAVITDPQQAHKLGLTLKDPESEYVADYLCSTPFCLLWDDEHPMSKSPRDYAQAKAGNPSIFSALYMGQPSPDDGEYFKRENFSYYDVKDLENKRLTIYGASDHAVSTQQWADYTVVGCVGVDENNDVYVLPDLRIMRADTDAIVKAMIKCMELNRPQCWYMEADVIGKTMGPFLRRSMREQGVHTPLETVKVTKDKAARARSLQGMMQAEKVFFPKGVSWLPTVEEQMLKFPAGRNDDVVDWLAHLANSLKSFQAFSVVQPVMRRTSDPVQDKLVIQGGVGRFTPVVRMGTNADRGMR